MSLPVYYVMRVKNSCSGQKVFFVHYLSLLSLFPLLSLEKLALIIPSWEIPENWYLFVVAAIMGEQPFS